MVSLATTSFMVKEKERKIQARSKDLESGTASWLGKVGDYTLIRSEQLTEPRP